MFRTSVHNYEQAGPEEKLKQWKSKTYYLALTSTFSSNNRVFSASKLLHAQLHIAENMNLRGLWSVAVTASKAASGSLAAVRRGQAKKKDTIFLGVYDAP